MQCVEQRGIHKPAPRLGAAPRRPQHPARPLGQRPDHVPGQGGAGQAAAKVESAEAGEPSAYIYSTP